MLKHKLYVIRCKKSVGKSEFSPKKNRFLSWDYKFTSDLRKAEVLRREKALDFIDIEEDGCYKGCFEIVEVELKLVK